MTEYHMVYITNDLSDPRYGDMAVHEGGSADTCNRCDPND